MQRTSPLLVVLAMAVPPAAGCAADPGPDLKDPDALVSPVDTGTLDTGGPPIDSGTPVDSGTPTDSGVDTSVPPPDTTPVDTGSPDTSVTDTGDGGPSDTPSDATCPTCEIKAYYYANKTISPSNEMKPWFDLHNTGTAPQPLSELTIRYWFTIDGEKAQDYHCDYAKVGCSNIKGTYTKLTTPKTDADYYIEISFDPAAGSIAAGGTTGEIQNRLNKVDYTNYIQTNDYSFDATKTTYAEWTKVTVYRKGVLIFGTEPP